MTDARIFTGPGPLPYVWSFQIVTPAANSVDLLYVPTPTAQQVFADPTPGNVILSLGSSKVSWASGSPSAPGGAVAGAETIFVSGSQLLAQPH
ncbi:MAG TPA: hypothetical protein VHZ99_02700 [Steroidobacteraceae bacterium]|nr:hypothetical protein [Steroidobacteraceae bacterium]